jgi:hypothetical protein
VFGFKKEHQLETLRIWKGIRRFIPYYSYSHHIEYNATRKTQKIFHKKREKLHTVPGTDE